MLTFKEYNQITEVKRIRLSKDVTEGDEWRKVRDLIVPVTSPSGLKQSIDRDMGELQYVHEQSGDRIKVQKRFKGFNIREIRAPSMHFGDDSFVYAEKNGEVVGFVQFKKWPGTAKTSLAGVLPKYQKKGLGTELHKFLIEKYGSVLSGFVMADAGIALYRSLFKKGYKVTGVTLGGRGDTEIHMIKGQLYTKGTNVMRLKARK